MKTPSVVCEICGKVNEAKENSLAGYSCDRCGSPLTVFNSGEVFISYTTANLDTARQVERALKTEGISCWLAPERIEMGESFLSEIDTALANAKVVVVILSSAAVESPWVLREITEAVSSRLPLLPLKIEEFELPREWKRLLSHNQYTEAFHQPFETYLDDLIRRAQEELLKCVLQPQPKPSPPAVLLPIEARPREGVDPALSPYVGPCPFTNRQKERFFGRQREARALLNQIRASRVVLIYAPSGAGKSSLLNTLVYEALDEQGFDVLLKARVGATPPRHIASAEINNIFTFSTICSLASTIIPNPKHRLNTYLKSIDRTPDTCGRVLVFDQFEELFTCHATRFDDRASFFDELILALTEDPTLRIVFAMRQEYLADLEPFEAKFPADLTMERYRLERLGPSGALEAITKPAERYANFAPGVAEDIVHQLDTIRVRGYDDVVVEKRGEFIEMVHLQIVCVRLWASLPKGITVIEKMHVEHAAGAGESFNEFVVNALNEFYEDTVQKVANSLETHEHGGFPRELIQLGCMKFVTTQSTRTMVPRTHDRIGRLPAWVVDQLEASHLLRVEQLGGVQWYELSHDRLAEPVARQINRKVSDLLYAADLLDKVLERILEDREGKLNGCFEAHHEVLKECQPFHAQVGLFPDEAEFLFRCSLATGQDSREWSRRLEADYPQLRVLVLREALVAALPMVRQNAATLLGLEPVAELEHELVRLVLSEDVAQYEAAISLLRLDKAVLFAGIADKVNDARTRGSAVRAMSMIRAIADGHLPTPSFNGFYAALNGSLQRKVRRRAWRLRFLDAQGILPYVYIPAALCASIAAASFKWLPGAFNFALCQASASAGMGVFHGVTAGFIWGGFIPLALVLYRVVFGNMNLPMRESFLHPFAMLIVGGIAGGLSGLLLTYLVTTVFTPTSVTTMGWTATTDRSSLLFWRELFLQTRFGWAYVITGTGLGVGLALMTNGLQSSAEWAAFLARQTRLTGLKETVDVLKGITRIAWRYAWPIPIAMTLAAVLAFAVQRPLKLQEKTTVAMRAAGTAADSATQAIGGFFAVVGLGLGLVIMRYGVQVQPRRDQV